MTTRDISSRFEIADHGPQGEYAIWTGFIVQFGNPIVLSK